VTNDEIAREILSARSYVVLATADEDGTPWATPVWFAMVDHAELYWVSHPGARHSHNIAARPQVAMVVFDSTAAPGSGQGVYMTATAEQLTDTDAIDRGIAVFARESAKDEAGEWDADRVTGDARLRLYRARVQEWWILDPDSPFDVRVGVTP
jgi:nitroimidazol reductase NimA-like FMN-containing flavoprotein (pyridoxamine 5'-phosphate oxidase superfamily)